MVLGRPRWFRRFVRAFDLAEVHMARCPQTVPATNLNALIVEGWVTMRSVVLAWGVTILLPATGWIVGGSAT
jgi:hypothetical protein